MKHYTLLLICLHILTFQAFSQSNINLIPNGDFEVLLSDSLIADFLKPKQFQFQMKDWNTPSYGSTDVLNPTFWYDNAPKSPKGNIAAGMKINTYYSKQVKDYVSYGEYIQCQLKEPLVVGRKYLVKFDISADTTVQIENSQYFGMHFSKDEIKDWDTQVLKRTPQVKMTTSLKREWQTVRQLYTPQEEFEYLTLGYFDQATKLKGVYFSIDNVAVTEVSGSNDAVSTYLDFLGEEVTLSNVHFNTNSSELLEKSFSELNKAVNWLNKHPEFTIEVQGHTDSDGELEDNQQLSEDRANAVKKYLIENEIPDYQIQTKGFGETIPIANNETNEGKALNRRVVLKKVKVLTNEDLYREAILYTRNNELDKAYATFERMTQLNQLPIQILIDQEFKALHGDKRWEKEVKSVIQTNFEQTVRHVRNKPLAFDLTIILLENQTFLQEDSIFWKGIRPFTEAFKPIQPNFNAMNQRHRQLFEKFLEEFEIFPGRFDISMKGVMSIFTVVHKSNDLTFQKEWLEKMEKTALVNREYKTFVAYITDKVARLENRPQIYGTQIIEGKMYKVIEPEKINERRAKMNLPRIRLSDY